MTEIRVGPTKDGAWAWWRTDDGDAHPCATRGEAIAAARENRAGLRIALVRADGSEVGELDRPDSDAADTTGVDIEPAGESGEAT